MAVTSATVLAAHNPEDWCALSNLDGPDRTPFQGLLVRFPGSDMSRDPVGGGFNHRRTPRCVYPRPPQFDARLINS